MMLVAYLTSLESLNGKTHAGTGIPQLSQSLKLRKRAQHDAFGHPTAVEAVARRHGTRKKKLKTAQLIME